MKKPYKVKIAEYCQDIRWAQGRGWSNEVKSMCFGLAIMRCCEKIERLEAKKARENTRIKLDI